MRSLLLVPVGIVCAAFSAQAINTIEPVSGDPHSLKGETGLRVEFAYADNLRVGEMAEADYVKKKRDEYNAKSAGNGDKWVSDWREVRTNKCEPNFERGANEAFTKAKVPLRLGRDITGAKYTMLVVVKGLDPGWSGKLVGQSAMVTADVTIVETANRQNLICRLQLDRMVGLKTEDALSTYTPSRIADAFHGCGRTLAKFLLKHGVK